MSDTYNTRVTLLTRLKSPDDELSWEEFIKYYEGFIYSIIIKMGVPSCDNDEVFQMAIIKLWKVLPNFNYASSKGRFRNWLYTVVKNIVYNYFDRMPRNELELLDVDSSCLKKDSPEIERLVEEEWDNHILSLAFDKVAKKVSKTAMDTFIKGLDGESVEAASKRLCLSESSIYVYRKRVKDALTAEVNNLREMLD